MSPRPKNIRKISEAPQSIGFIPMKCKRYATIEFHLEEYESIKLCDYEMLTQAEAASQMGISRPTLTRIYASARQKIARALVEQSAITIEGGKNYMESDWYECIECGMKFNNIDPNIRPANICCPVCKSHQLKLYNEENNITKLLYMKKIALPTRGGVIDNHFGHCEFYTILTINDENQIVSTETIPSPQGCGCKSNIASKFEEDGVTVMLAGNMGPGALQKLSEHGVEVVRGCSGPVMEVAQAYLAGELKDSGVGCQHHDGDHECGHHGEGEHHCHHGEGEHHCHHEE